MTFLASGIARVLILAVFSSESRWTTRIEWGKKSNKKKSEEHMLPPVTINSDCFVVFVASAAQHNICSNPKWTGVRAQICGDDIIISPIVVAEPIFFG